MKYFIAFLTGATAGAIATYLYFNKKINEIVRNTVNEEMEKFLARQEDILPKVDAEEVTENTEKEVVDDKPNTADKTSIVKMEEIVHTNYRDDDDDEIDDDYISDEEVEELMETSRKRMSEGPHIVTEAEHDQLVGYDCTEYTWYPDDNTIKDIFDNLIDDDIDWMFVPIDWRKELKDKESIIIRVPSEATDFVLYNGKLFGANS